MAHNRHSSDSVNESTESIERSAGMSEKVDRRRFTIELSNRLDAELEELANKLGRKKSELLRLAIEYILAADEAKSAGLKVGAWQQDESGNIESTREFIGIR